MQKRILISALFMLWFIQSNIAVAAEVEFASSPNPVGSGARAIGMGGAFIAVADDATAASWNPGGLLQLDTPEISFVYNHFRRTEDIYFGIDFDSGGEQPISAGNINYLSIVYPFNLPYNETNMVFAFSYQHLYDFTQKWNYLLHKTDEDLKEYYQQDGHLSAIGFALGVKVLRLQTDIALTVNIWNDSFLGLSNKWKEEQRESGSGVDPKGTSYSFESTKNVEHVFERGVNANIGILWHKSDDTLKIGAVLKLPFRAIVKEETEKNLKYIEAVSIDDSEPPFSDKKLDMPMSYGFGIAWRPLDELTLSLDIYKTEWQNYIMKDSDGEETSPITGKLVSESDIDPTIQVRWGGEYVFTLRNVPLISSGARIPIRWGIFYDPAPSEGTNDDFYGFSVGAGFTDFSIGTATTNSRCSFDFAFQYREGNDVGKSMIQSYDFSQDVREYSCYFSLIKYF